MTNLINHSAHLTLILSEGYFYKFSFTNAVIWNIRIQPYKDYTPLKPPLCRISRQGDF